MLLVEVRNPFQGSDSQVSSDKRFWIEGRLAIPLFRVMSDDAPHFSLSHTAYHDGTGKLLYQHCYLEYLAGDGPIWLLDYAYLGIF